MKNAIIRCILAPFVLGALLLAPAAALASTDLSGTWNGTLSGAIQGTITLTIVDAGDVGTLGGTITGAAGDVAITGTFTQVGRHVVGEIDAGGLSVRFAGRANRIGEHTVWRFAVPNGGRVTLELTKVA